MTASDHLSGQQFMYHRSPRENRSSIRKEGLKASQSPLRGAEGIVPPRGVYLGHHEYLSHPLGGGFDLWKVDTTGLKLHPDPEHLENKAGSMYTPASISPDRVKLHKAAKRWPNG